MISVIIPSFNNEDLLRKNLPGLIRSTAELKAEIIVVNDGSGDGTPDLIRNSFPEVRLIDLKKNLGFGGAANTGAEAALGDLLLFLNSDISVDEDFLKPLVELFSGHPDLFAASPRILRTREGLVNEAITAGKFAGGTICTEHMMAERVPDQNIRMPIFYACGGAMLVNRRKFLELGGFDQIYSPFYYEDVDLSYRAWKRGWKILYEPSSAVYHDHEGTIGKNFGRRYIRTIQTRNRYIFIWKNIHDKDMIKEHVLHMLIPKALIPNIYEWAGLAGALKRLPEILNKRAREKKASKSSDAQVFAQFKDLNKYM